MKTLLKDLEEKFESIQALKLLALNDDKTLLASLAVKIIFIYAGVPFSMLVMIVLIVESNILKVFSK